VRMLPMYLNVGGGWKLKSITYWVKIIEKQKKIQYVDIVVGIVFVEGSGTCHCVGKVMGVIKIIVWNVI